MQLKINKSLKEKKICFIFKAGRATKNEKNKAFPTEFFYGYCELKKRGYNVSYLEDIEIGMAWPLCAWARWIHKLTPVLFHLPFGVALNCVFSGGFRELNRYDICIATTNTNGLALALLKAVGVLKPKLYFITMGLVSQTLSSVVVQAYRFVLTHCRLISLSKEETRFLNRKLNRKDIHHVPFGVDVKFWSSSNGSHATNYVLAIGNDMARDWMTLVRAWRPDFPVLKIVTNLPVPRHPSNVEVISGDWRLKTLTDEAVRDLYRGARFVVVPLRETVQPSGQSVCLQAMACGKAVIISDIKGIWDRNLMRDGETALTTPPGNATALAEKVGHLLSDRALADRLGVLGRSVVEKHMNADTMAEELLKIINTEQFKEI
jgi:glycosyltransferase involved in cell wall biosynthesis